MTKSSREIIKMLEADGWLLVRVAGSHHQFKHPIKTRKGYGKAMVTVPHPEKDIPTGTLRSIYRQAGWDWKRS